MSSFIKIFSSFNPDAYEEMSNKFQLSYTPVWQTFITDTLHVDYLLDSRKFKGLVGLWELISILLIFTNMYGVGVSIGCK